MNKDKLEIEHYLSLYQLTKCNDSTDDIECQIEALKQYYDAILNYKIEITD